MSWSSTIVISLRIFFAAEQRLVVTGRKKGSCEYNKHTAEFEHRAWRVSLRENSFEAFNPFSSSPPTSIERGGGGKSKTNFPLQQMVGIIVDRVFVSKCTLHSGGRYILSRRLQVSDTWGETSLSVIANYSPVRLRAFCIRKLIVRFWSWIKRYLLYKIETNELRNYVQFFLLCPLFSFSFQTAWILLRRERHVNSTLIKSAEIFE